MGELRGAKLGHLIDQDRIEVGQQVGGRRVDGDVSGLESTLDAETLRVGNGNAWLMASLSL